MEGPMTGDHYGTPIAGEISENGNPRHKGLANGRSGRNFPALMSAISGGRESLL